MTEIELPAGRVDADALVFLLPGSGPARLRVPAKSFWDPSALATLAVWGRARREAGDAVSIEGDEGVLGYLSRMDVLDALGLPRQELGERRASDGRFVTATPLEDADGAFTDAVCDLVLHHFDDAPAFLPALEWAVNEVVDNVHIHADAATPGYACAQFYPHRHRLDLVVVDPGRGRRASLGASHPVPDDHAAIRRALERGVTRDSAIGQGNGLAGTREIVRANGGSLSVWTGTCRFRMNKDGEQPPKELAGWRGTGLRLSLDTRKPVDLQDTFIEGTGWSYIDALAESVSEDGLRIAGACSFFGARPPATRLRRKVRALLDAMEGDRLVLDFDGIPTASSSFLDELLGRLADELGREAFGERVVVRNASPEVARRANVVITQRVGGGIRSCTLQGGEQPRSAEVSSEERSW